MPIIAGLQLLIAITFAVHAMKSGRPQWWLYIILFVPVLGVVAYILIELLPELASTRRAREVQANIGTILDPDREWRERLRRAEVTDSADAKRALAEECMRKGRWEDAITLYKTAARGVFADDPFVLRGLAEAQLGAGKGEDAIATLDTLRAAHPDLSHQEAHLLYARALESIGKPQEALHEYEAVSQYYAGFEARVRWGLLLVKQGWPERAQELFNEAVRASKARGIVVTSEDKQWIRVAQAQLR
jgi:hypothetical protein